MSKTVQLGDLQLAIMRKLWEREEATVSQVHADLQEERGLAPTTIATMLKKMERKGVVRHRMDGRRFIYRPTVSEADVRASMVSQLTEQLFEGEATALVSHLLSSEELSEEELAKIRSLVADAATEERGR